ncbi:hypothetical protein [Bradyrhizobium sp. 153]|uniref:hypothetical protein n=1 Tax=Bradyrhizobium sp. 153 TaxID=2782627 RepID=UPI001FFB8E91|nr:hypothetical protein [Bradyrhizobium sp. 153]MCK1665230.1 hypothetical protein [Bradyrhizobium sp. 153]
MIAQKHLVAYFLRERRVRNWQELIVRLVNHKAALPEYIERDEWDAPCDQYRGRIQRGTLAERFFDLIDVRVHPMLHVFAFDPDRSGFRGTRDEVKPPSPRSERVPICCGGSSLLYMLLSSCALAFKAPVEVGIGQFAERAVRCNLQN